MVVRRCGGHLFGNVRNGDYLILKNGPGTTRYQITSTRFYADPGDMYWVTCKFAPRQADE